MLRDEDDSPLMPTIFPAADAMRIRVFKGISTERTEGPGRRMRSLDDLTLSDHVISLHSHSDDFVIPAPHPVDG